MSCLLFFLCVTANKSTSTPVYQRKCGPQAYLPLRTVQRYGSSETTSIGVGVGCVLLVCRVFPVRNSGVVVEALSTSSIFSLCNNRESSTHQPRCVTACAPFSRALLHYLFLVMYFCSYL